MNKINEIKETINKYEELVEFTRERIYFIEKYGYRKYDTRRGIESIDFYDDSVGVICDDTCYGCYDSYSFNFPLHFLTLSEEELKSELEKENKENVEKERKIEEEKKLKEKNEREKRELMQYKRLKSKFEKIIINNENK